MKRFAFPKSSRLLKNSSFKAVLSEKLAASDNLFIVYMAPNDTASPRLGISISKSVANSVLRNRIKRLVRETFRKNRRLIPQPFDYVVMLSAGLSKSISKDSASAFLKRLTLEDVCASFLSVVEQIGQTGRLDVK